MTSYDDNIWKCQSKDLPKLFVYTMGKVASSSVSDSLISAGIPCLDIHSLAGPRILGILKAHLESDDFNKVPPHFVRSLKAYNSMIYNDQVKIISLIREPISRNISAVFQNLPQKFSNEPKEISARLKNYNTSMPQLWFERDLKPATGLDVLNAEVDSTQSAFRFTNDKCDLLMLKLEEDDTIIEKTVSEFVGAKISLKRSNVGENKWYNDIYKTVKNNPNSVSESFLSECFNLDYYKKFYSYKERLTLAKKLGFSLSLLNKPDLYKKSSNLVTDYNDMLETERKQLYYELRKKGWDFSAISRELCYVDEDACKRDLKRWSGTIFSGDDAEKTI